MLSRVADALFWMSRYLERAEQIARLLDVSFHQELDLFGPGAETEELHDVLTILQAAPGREAGNAAVSNGAARNGTRNGAGPAADVPDEAPEHGSGVGDVFIRHWLTFDLENPNSIVSCVNKARNNARSIRGTISTPMWRELNKLYWTLRDPEFSSRAMDSPHDFYGAVEEGSHLLQGACDATLVRDEGWQFIQLGKYLERADKTLRILDAKQQRLHQPVEAVELPFGHLRWAAVLKSCLGHEAYTRRFLSRVEPERVIEFLLLHGEFPRSVRFSLESAARALESLEGRPAERGELRADRILGRVISDLRFAEVETLLARGLHEYLQSVLENCWHAAAAVQREYALGE